MTSTSTSTIVLEYYVTYRVLGYTCMILTKCSQNISVEQHTLHVPTLRLVLIERNFCEDSQSSQKQLQRQDKFKKIARLLSAHNLRKLDFWICGGYGSLWAKWPSQNHTVHWFIFFHEIVSASFARARDSTWLHTCERCHISSTIMPVVVVVSLDPHRIYCDSSHLMPWGPRPRPRLDQQSNCDSF